MSWNLLGLGEVITGVGKVADDLFTSDKERLTIALEEKKLELEGKKVEAALVQGQLDINKEEAKSSSVFVAGWRPFIGWVGGLALAYQFLLYPLLTWMWALLKAKGVVPADMAPPPMLATDALFALISAMLGIAGLRSFDKFKGTDTSSVGNK
ncbi:MAG: hypothetical protein RL375_3006 [Pseudomonadota bacterium]|jgi:hypothetical protein